MEVSDCEIQLDSHLSFLRDKAGGGGFWKKPSTLP